MLLNKFIIEPPKKRIVLSGAKDVKIQLQVYDTFGDLVHKTEFHKNNDLCDLSHLSGSYLLRFFEQDQICSEPITL